VTFSGWVVDRGIITITTSEGLKISMEPVTALVESGQRVRRGQQIALLEPGHCVSLCLHLGVRVGQEYRSARQELGLLQRAILLPWDL
jgi:murein DD-endopeptidase MepM/ murein hydrolase activator NlpD